MTAGMLEDKIVSNSLIEWHDMCVKAFSHIELARKSPPNYYAKKKLTDHEAKFSA